MYGSMFHRFAHRLKFMVRNGWCRLGSIMDVLGSLFRVRWRPWWPRFLLRTLPSGAPHTGVPLVIQHVQPLLVLCFSQWAIHLEVVSQAREYDKGVRYGTQLNRSDVCQMISKRGPGGCGGSRRPFDWYESRHDA